MRLAGRIGGGPAAPMTDAHVSDEHPNHAAAADRDAAAVALDEWFRGSVQATLPDPAAHALAVSILRGIAGQSELLRTLHAYLVHVSHWQPAVDELTSTNNTPCKRGVRKSSEPAP